MIRGSEMIKQGIILASGLGSRLNSEGRNEPKPLMPIGGMALIERVITLMKLAGIEHIVIVLGYRGDQIKKFISDRGMTGIVTVENEEYNKKNGISLLKGGEALNKGEPFLLSMSDHIFSNDFMADFIQKAEPQLEEAETVLSVDRDIENVFDLDDATKVFTEENIITKIDKQLPAYNAVDTGLFICKPSILEELDKLYKENGDVSISEGMKVLGDKNKFHACDMTGYLWQDVDTPAMKNEAEQRLVDNCIDNVPEKDFFSNRFFLKLSKEMILSLLKKENFDFRIFHSFFFILILLLSMLSIKSGSEWLTIISLLGATFIHYFERIRLTIKPVKSGSPFFLFSYEFTAAIAFLPVILENSTVLALIYSALLLFVIFAKFTGQLKFLQSQFPPLSSRNFGTWFSPSLFFFIYSGIVILPVFSFLTAIITILYMAVFVTNNTEFK